MSSRWTELFASFFKEKRKELPDLKKEVPQNAPKEDSTKELAEKIMKLMKEPTHPSEEVENKKPRP